MLVYSDGAVGILHGFAVLTAVLLFLLSLVIQSLLSSRGVKLPNHFIFDSEQHSIMPL